MVAPYILSTNSTANNNIDSITSHIFEYETHPVPLFRTVPVTRSIVSVVGSENAKVRTVVYVTQSAAITYIIIIIMC